MDKRTLFAGWSAGAALALALAASPAAADVKAGVDAWARGDYTSAVREWQGPAASGDADAQFNLAQAFRSGRGVQADLRKAEELFGKAAAQGHLQAADNYGLMLFQRGERAAALPYITASADRGDPRAQYYLGLAHFNGDLVAKDWVRGYALVSLASQSGLEQARPALAQMDRYVPLAQRQQAVALAGQLAAQALANRNRQLAAVELGSAGPRLTGTPASRPAEPSRTPEVTAAEDAIAAAIRVSRGANPRAAGADYARPASPATAAAPAALPNAKPVVSTQTPARPVPSSPSASGSWRVQLGAFSVPSNADALWTRVAARPELAGHARINVASGRITRLQAGGFASQSSAAAACGALAKAGFACLVMRN